jgi:hypothetical protein
MCSTEIVAATASGALAGAPLGPAGIIAGATLAGTTAAGIEGKGPLAGLKTKVPKVKPPRDITAEEKRERARELRRLQAARPGPGRAATIFTRGTGSGPQALKTKTGQ